MFEAAELGRKVTKEEYEKKLAGLRSSLLTAQFAAREARIPLIVIVSGVEGAGKGEMVHRLNGWFDPRGVETHAFWDTSDEESERPAYWRFWRSMPARGRIGIFFGSWYTAPIIRRVFGKSSNSELDSALERIVFLEKMLADDGIVIVKLWMHLSKKKQRERLQQMAKDPLTRWRVTKADRKNCKLYSKFSRVSERAIRRTDAAHAPWHVVEATDRRYRELEAGRLILEALQQALENKAKKEKPAPVKTSTVAPRADHAISILDRVDLKSKLTEAAYDKEMDQLQSDLTRLTWAAREKKVATVALFEGWDAAGKGGAIRRVVEAIDPRLISVVPIAAPTDEERAHHYLWRFWRHLPRDGRMVIFDRTWYGRVLVERVEGFATEAEWRRAYLEINDFEEQLVEHGGVLAKFWLHISKAEQLRRFEERQRTPTKVYKITEEDWRNRKRWPLYEDAINEMVARTSTEFAPWTLVAGNDKLSARVQILRELVARLERVL
ncbi:MAG: polyphosphate:AMP phosphotransferase [Opitutaceae bacterium]|nr:polyphosphate:AMP phosphotransferase [Opitutaceae bacterium]